MYRVLSLLVFCFHLVHSRSTGAPAGACGSITPGHGGSSQPVPGGFFLYSTLIDCGGNYAASQSYTVKLEGSQSFKGFLIQARQFGSATPIGSFSSLPSGTKTLTCSAVATASVTHTNNNLKSSVTFTWTAPSTSGTVEFRYAVVVGFSTYYANINATQFRPSGSSCTISSSPVMSSSNVVSSSTVTSPSIPETTTIASSIIISSSSATLSSSDTSVTSFSMMTSSEAVPSSSSLAILSSTNIVELSSEVPSSSVVTSSFILTSTSVMESSSLILFTSASSIALPSPSASSVMPDPSSTFYSLGFSASSVSIQPSSTPTCPSTDKTPSFSFPIIFRTPPNCERELCTFYWAMGANTANPQYLDVYMEGIADGWMAVGFSDNKMMGATDVLGCRVLNSMVTVVDSWNPLPNYSFNQLDNTQDGLCTYNASYSNGRISCLFSRSTSITDVGQDLDLNNNLWIIQGYRTNSQTGLNLLYHTSTPQFSLQRYNPLTDNNQADMSIVTSAAITISSSTSVTITPTIIPTCPNTDKTSSSSFPIVFRTPNNCEREKCTFYWAMGPNTANPQYLDVYMEGTTDGWLAVGFSDDQIMANTDVLGCRVNTDNTVTVVDGWNPTPNRSPNQLDNTQEGLCTYNTGYTNGRISCLFSRSSEIKNSGQDLNLNASLWIIRGFRAGSQLSGFSNLLYHSETPQFSSKRYNPLMDSNIVSSSSSVQPTSTPVPSTCPSTDKMESSSFPIIFRTPPNCERELCTFYWAMGANTANPQYLDVYMEGTAAGWLAVGFSKDQNMDNTDVIGCRVNGDNTITIIDSWNPSGFHIPNQLDATQEGLCPQKAEYINGRISCLLSRSVVEINLGQDYDLNDSFWIITGFRLTSQTSSSLSYHSETPQISTQRYNPLKDTNQDTSAPPVVNITCPNGPPSNANYSVSAITPDGNYYFAARRNDENNYFLDFQLEGKAEGWIAIGFTPSLSMYDADVLACKRDSSSGFVYAIDTWNPSGSRRNIIDGNQTGMCQHATEYNNGRIKCIFSRYIGIINEGHDLNLNQSLYRIYDAWSSNGGLSTSPLRQHDHTPTFSDRSNLVSDTLTGREDKVDIWPKLALIKTHGILMLTAWVLLATSAVFFAAWMKPTLPNGEWFQVHRALMIGSLFVGAAGFIFAFVAHAKNTAIPGLIGFDSKGLNTTHFIFGIVVMCLHIANPLIALCRCKPTAPHRWIFNLTHAHIIGYGALLLALINIAIGIALLEVNNFKILPFYIVFLVLLLAFQVVLFLIYILYAHKAPKENRSALVHSLLKYKYLLRSSSDKSDAYELSDVKRDNEKNETIKKDDATCDENVDKAKPQAPAKKKPLKSAPVYVSWIATAIHLVAIVLVVIILIALIASN